MKQVLEIDLGMRRSEFERLKQMLTLIFPDVAKPDMEFVLQLTPDQLKKAYMRQAAACHPKTAVGGVLPDRERRYRQLFQAYKAVLPQIQAVHRRVQRSLYLEHPDFVGNDEQGRTILAVGGAKGGVGKSALSANLAVGLALLGQRVILADLDLGGADVHLYAGVRSLQRTWNDFLDKKVDDLEALLVQTPFAGLKLIGGDAARLGSANLPYLQKLKMMRHLKALDSDFVIVDLGGDTSYHVLDFFLLSDHKLVVSGTEPASILDTYSFLKVAFFRFLDRFFSQYKTLKDLRRKVQEATAAGSGSLPMDSVLEAVRSRDLSAYVSLKEQFEKYHLSMILNMTESPRDANITESMRQLLKKNYQLDMEILGTIPFDHAVRKAARRFTPFVVEDPRCKASQALYRVLAGILLFREPQSVRTELMTRLGAVREDAKLQIGEGPMTLENSSSKQIAFSFERSAKLHRSFQKILSLMNT